MDDSNTMIRKGHSYVGSIPLQLEVLLDIRELLINNIEEAEELE